jgi:hypothetical protein
VLKPKPNPDHSSVVVRRGHQPHVVTIVAHDCGVRLVHHQEYRPAVHGRFPGLHPPPVVVLVVVVVVVVVEVEVGHRDSLYVCARACVRNHVQIEVPRRCGNDCVPVLPIRLRRIRSDIRENLPC